jgi:hypothetical protein
VCGGGVCVGGGGRAFYYTYITTGKDSPAREPSWSAIWLQKPSILRVCVREEDAGGREAGAHSTTPTYTTGKDSPAREPSWSAIWLQKPSILRVCVREEDAGGREAGAHSTTPTYTTGKDSPAREPSWSACVYYCSTYYKAVRVGGGGGQWRTCATRDYEPRPVGIRD